MKNKCLILFLSLGVIVLFAGCPLHYSPKMIFIDISDSVTINFDGKSVKTDEEIPLGMLFVFDTTKFNYATLEIDMLVPDMLSSESSFSARSDVLENVYSGVGHSIFLALGEDIIEQGKLDLFFTFNEEGYYRMTLFLRVYDITESFKKYEEVGTCTKEISFYVGKNL